jgi:hypothetical protein
MTHLRLKRHYKLLLLLILVMVGLPVAAGDQPIVAYSLQDIQHSSDATITSQLHPATPVEPVPGGIWAPETSQASSQAGAQ